MYGRARRIALARTVAIIAVVIVFLYLKNLIDTYGEDKGKQIFEEMKKTETDPDMIAMLDEEYYADIVFMDVLKNNSDSARIRVTVDNPLGEEITDISIANLTTEIEEQTFKDGKSEVIIKVSNPSVFTSKYAVNSITSISPNGFKSTRKYQSNELFLRVDLFRKIYTVDEFIREFEIHVNHVNKTEKFNYDELFELEKLGYIKCCNSKLALEKSKKK